MFKYLTIYTKVLQTMKTGSTNHHTAISSTQQVSRHDEGSIHHDEEWHIDLFGGCYGFGV